MGASNGKVVGSCFRGFMIFELRKKDDSNVVGLTRISSDVIE
jgi:hypothetical protein